MSQRESASGPAAAHTRLHLTRRGRVVLTALVSVPLVAAALFFSLNGGGALAAGGSQAHFTYATVQSGDSLWNIAERIAPSSDPREVIADIVSLNQLSSTVVSPGQRIAIPLEYAR